MYRLAPGERSLQCLHPAARTNPDSQTAHNSDRKEAQSSERRSTSMFSETQVSERELVLVINPSQMLDSLPASKAHSKRFLVLSAAQR